MINIVVNTNAKMTIKLKKIFIQIFNEYVY